MTSSASTSVKSTLREFMVMGATELFAAYAVPCTLREGRPSDVGERCGILGFTGATLCGSVIIAATSDAIASSNPLGDGPSNSWVGELTNQLVGRFKNFLLKQSVDIAISIPVVLTAVQIVPVPVHSIEPIPLNVGTGMLTIWVEYEGTPVFRDPTQEISVVEGEVLLF